MIRKFSLLFALLLVFGLVGCEVEGDEDADGGTDVVPDTDTNPDTDTDTTTNLAYRFVRIDDVTVSPGGENIGADLDAVILTKAVTGTQFFAENVESYTLGDGDVANQNSSEITKAPDAFAGWANGDLSECDGNEGFVALGQGGQIVVRMGGEIEAGDNLTVLELSRCELESGLGTASDDDVQVYVSVAAEPGGTWELVGGGIGPEISLSVPALPAVPAP
ncbi:MAG: hypothetical protein RBU37_04525 [Myxococcota bacterium]|jgi:hypothetical protein|nr:hypothetical protein [Myxococcota bacterium]